jgi:hypothetical protein
MRRGDRKIQTVRYISRTVLLLHSGCSFRPVAVLANTTPAGSNTTFGEPCLSLLFQRYRTVVAEETAGTPPPWWVGMANVSFFNGLRFLVRVKYSFPMVYR